MSKYILSYNLNSISYGYEKLSSQLNNLGSALFIYRGLWLLKNNLDKTTICESIKTYFTSTDDFLIFEIEHIVVFIMLHKSYKLDEDKYSICHYHLHIQ